jgi:hypothetical protein
LRSLASKDETVLPNDQPRRPIGRVAVGCQLVIPIATCPGWSTGKVNRPSGEIEALIAAAKGTSHADCADGDGWAPVAASPVGDGRVSFDLGLAPSPSPWNAWTEPGQGGLSRWPIGSSLTPTGCAATTAPRPAARAGSPGCFKADGIRRGRCEVEPHASARTRQSNRRAAPPAR